MPSPFPGSGYDTWSDKSDGQVDHAADVNGAWHAAIAAQLKVGLDADTRANATIEGRMKNEEARLTVSTSAPASPTLHDVWIDASASPAITNYWGGSAWVPAGTSLTIEADGTPVTPEPALNFGPGFTATDTPGTATTIDPTYGATAGTIAEGNDTRFTDARPPLPHATTHTGSDMIPVFGASGTHHAPGLVPDPGAAAGSTRMLREDGLWSAPPGATGGGPTLQQDDVGIAAEPIMDFHAPLRATDNPGATRTDITVDVFQPSGTGHLEGLVPDPGGTAGASRYLCEDGSWTAPPGSAYPPTYVGTSTPGLVPAAPGSPTLNFLRGDGAWAVPPGTGGGGGGGGAEPGVAPQVAPPNAASWTLVNGGASTLTDELDGVVHLAAQGSTGTNVRLAHKAAPSTPYTIKARFRLNLRGTGNTLAGLVFYSTGDGKLTGIVLQNSGTPTFLVCEYSSVTSYSSQYTTEAAQFSARDVWFRLTDDGSTHRTYAYSYDGVNWITLTDVSHTDFHTPDHIGWMGDPQSVNRDFQVTLVSYEES